MFFGSCRPPCAREKGKAWSGRPSPSHDQYTIHPHPRSTFLAMDTRGRFSWEKLMRSHRIAYSTVNKWARVHPRARSCVRVWLAYYSCYSRPRSIRQRGILETCNCNCQVATNQNQTGGTLPNGTPLPFRSNILAENHRHRGQYPTPGSNAAFSYYCINQVNQFAHSECSMLRPDVKF